MKSPAELVFHAFHLCVVKCAALLVPGKQRGEWYREWKAELWHVCQERTPADGFSWSGEREVVEFCLGAFSDAFCMYRDDRPKRSLLTEMRGSAAQCILILVAVLATCYAVATLSPRVRTERSLLEYPVYPGLVLIQDIYSNGHSVPAISPAQYRVWATSRQKYFDRFAFYRVAQESVSVAPHTSKTWGVARASSNLFAMLNVPLQFAAPVGGANSDLTSVILSNTAWKREFGGDPHIVGSIVRVGTSKARIAGVAPEGSWRLPGKVDAWLLEPDSAFAHGSVGYVVAHLTPLGESELWASSVQITSYRSDDTEDNLLGIALNPGSSSPGAAFLFAVFLAILVLPGTTSVSMGEYSFSSHPQSWSERLCLWGFLGAKIALLLPIAYFASLDLTYSFTTIYSPTSVMIHLFISFTICVLGFRWALLDQRQRCPVCLRRVAHPARVGYSSQNFLAWNGTELICEGGHTLLHIPGLETSWFSTQRWLYLDTSWEFLFAGSGK